MEQLATDQESKGASLMDATGTRRITGAQKALLFLLSIEEGVASQILSFLNDEEMRKIRRASEELAEVEVEAIAAIHREFAERVQKGVPQPIKGSGAYLKKLASKAMGESRASELWSEKTTGAVAALARLDIGTVIGLLENEQPQTIAVVLAELDPSKAAEILKWFSPEKQGDVLLRMTRLKSVPLAVIAEIEQHFSAEIDALGSNERKDIEGLGVAASLLKRLPNEIGEQLIEAISNTDSALANELKRALFTFEDLIRIDGRGMQVFLQEVATPQLILALKTASDELKDKIFGNVSQRAAAMLRDELEMLGPVRLADVEAAQRAAVEIALQLEKEGRIQILREGGADFV